MTESFSYVATESLIMLVRHEEGPLSAVHTAVIRKHFYKMLDETQIGYERPIFVYNKLFNGVDVIVCANGKSFDWLSHCLSVMDKQADLTLKFNSTINEIPKRKVVLFLPDREQIETKLLFRRLSEANANLDTASWTLLRDLGATSNGRTLIFAVDLASVRFILYLRTVNFFI